MGKNPIDVEKVARFIQRLLVRTNMDGIIISYSSFTETALVAAKEALSLSVIALVDLRDIFNVLNQEKDLADFFSNLIRNVKLYKNPKPIVDLANIKDINYNLYI